MEYIGPGKIRNFKALLTIWSAADALDMCIFAVAPTRILSLVKMAEMLYASTGWETSSHEVMRYGERRLHLMQWYNRREGLTDEHDRLPERFYTEKLPTGPRKGDIINREAFHASIKSYYEMMGWDEKGTPRKATLYDHSLEWVLRQDE